MSVLSGTSGSSSLVPTSFVTSILSSSIIPTALSTSISGAGSGTNATSSSSASATLTPWHYVQPPPDTDHPETTAPVVVATTLFTLGVFGGIIYFIRAWKIKKREAAEATLTHGQRARLAEARRLEAKRKGKMAQIFGGG